MILDALKHASFADQLTFVDAPLAKDEQILLAHTAEHLETIKRSAPVSGSVALDGDTVMSPGSLNAALRGAGAACLAIDDLIANKYEAAFCAIRPPGHHCTPDHAMGFCIFNNIAIAALYAQQQPGLNHVAIVDFDVHHGNGSQDILSGKKDVLYISTHQSPFYPGSGSEAENIPGNILNIPLPSGMGNNSYQEVFTEDVLPALQQFKPELLLVSAGFDAHRDDPLAGLAFTEETYRWLGEQLQNVVNQTCRGKFLSVLEGGYNLNVLGSSVKAYLEGILAIKSKN